MISRTLAGPPGCLGPTSSRCAADDARRTLEVLGNAGFETMEADPAWLYKAVKDDVLVDVIFMSDGRVVLDDEMMARAVSETVQGVEVPVIPPEDLIVIKALVHREATARHWYDALALLERVQPRGRGLARPPDLLLPLARPLKPLRDVPDFRAQPIRVHPQRFEPAAQLQEARQIVLQGERVLQRRTEGVDLGAQPLGVFRGRAELRLRASLDAGHGLGLLVQCGEHGRQPLQGLDARLEVGHGLLRFRDRLGELPQVLRGVARAVHQRFERDALPLHLGEDRAKFGGELLGRGLLPEYPPGGHDEALRR